MQKTFNYGTIILKVLLTTYPRSGQHYLVDLFKQQLDYDLDFTHDLIIKGYDKYITIVRNPYDCILSWVIMEVHCGPIEGSRAFPMEKYMDKAIREYILFYKYVLKNVDILINYENLVGSPNKVVSYLAQELGLIKQSDSYNSTIVDRVSGRFLRTSTTSHLYDEIKKELDSRDLSQCYDIFNIAISKCSKL